MAKRIFADIILFLSIFFAPWYVTVGLGAVFIIVFSSFWEAVLAGIFLDAMYYMPGQEGLPTGQAGLPTDQVGVEMPSIYGRFGVFTLVPLVLILFIEKIKKQIRI